VRVVSVHMQLGTMLSGIVVVEAVAVDLVVSGHLRCRCSENSWVARRLSFRAETGSGFGEV